MSTSPVPRSVPVRQTSTNTSASPASETQALRPRHAPAVVDRHRARRDRRGVRARVRLRQREAAEQLAADEARAEALAQLGLAEARDRVRDRVVHREREGVGGVAAAELLEDVHRLGQRGALAADRPPARRGRAARRPRGRGAASRGKTPRRLPVAHLGLDDVVGVTARGERERRAGRVGVRHGAQSTLRPMRAVVQRVTRAEVRVEGVVVGAIGAGSRDPARRRAGRRRGRGRPPRGAPRAAADLPGRGRALRPQPARHGRRGARREPVHALRRQRQGQPPELLRGRRSGASPSRSTSASASSSRPRAWARVERGRFGAHMQVELVNDGPVTIVVELRALTVLPGPRTPATVQPVRSCPQSRCRCWKGGFSDPPFLCPGPVMTAGQEDTDIWLYGTQKRSQRTSSACSAPPCPRSTSSTCKVLPGGVLRVLVDHPGGRRSRTLRRGRARARRLP